LDLSFVGQGGQVVREEVFWGGPPLGRGSLFGILPMHLVWNFVVVLLVVLIFWWLVRGSQKNDETGMDILKKRYAAGEIDRKTYLQMKKDITD